MSFPTTCHNFSATFGSKSMSSDNEVPMGQDEEVYFATEQEEEHEENGEADQYYNDSSTDDDEEGDDDSSNDSDNDDRRRYCNEYLPLAEEVDDTVFGKYDCGPIALHDINAALGAVSDTDFFLETLTDDDELGSECYSNLNFYPDLGTFNRGSTGSTVTYNQYLFQLLYEVWEGKPVRVRITLSYNETPNHHTFFYHAYRVRITFNNILVYSGAQYIPIDYLQKGAIFAILQLRNKGVGRIVDALSHTPMGGNGNCISTIMGFIA